MGQWARIVEVTTGRNGASLGSGRVRASLARVFEAADAASLAPLRGDVDIERLLRAVPPSHTIKGAFLAPNAAIVGMDWPRIESTLRSPPRGGKYLTFSNYALFDHVLLSDLAARRKYPRMPTREAHRILSRDTMEVFSKTTLGRVALTLVSGPKSLLFKYEDIFNSMVAGPRLAVRELDDMTVELAYTDYYSTTEAIFGVIEGAILACKLVPTVTVEKKGEGRFVATASWAHW